ncbi:ATP-grasp domain-containing protein [Blastococcus xanthinilyticus]|nr:hypothetical protein [Blastococcus xanthinilyticus]
MDAGRTGSPSAVPAWFVVVELPVRPRAARTELAAGERLDPAGVVQLDRALDRGLQTAVLTLDRAGYGPDDDWVVDRWIECDTFDADAVLQAVRALEGVVVAVTSAVPGFAGTAAVAARALGLRGPTPGSAALADDRGALHRALADAGLPGVDWAEVAAHDPDLTSPIGYPCVVRPVDGGGAFDAGLVSDDRELRALAARHLARPDYGRGMRPRRLLVVEEHVPGPRFGVDGYVDGSDPVVLAWSEVVTTPPPHLDSLVRTATTRPPVPEAIDWVRAWLAATGHDAGPFHLEFLLGPAGPRLADLGPGLPGGGGHACTDLVSGVDTADLAVGLLLGEPPAVPAPGAAGASTQVLLVAHAVGVVREVAGVREAAGIPGLVAAEVVTDVGRVAGPATCWQERLGQVVTVGDTPEQSWRRAAAALDAIQVDVVAPALPRPAPRPGARSCRDVAASSVVVRRRGPGSRIR